MCRACKCMSYCELFSNAVQAFGVDWSSPITCSIYIDLCIGVFLTENLSIPPGSLLLNHFLSSSHSPSCFTWSLSSLNVLGPLTLPVCSRMENQIVELGWSLVGHISEESLLFLPQKSSNTSVISDKYVTSWASTQATLWFSLFGSSADLVSIVISVI